ncbi:hypothetical protein EAI90_06360 [Faecalibacterium prausnitzii]|nr:hypothetical protein EAI90_06360 [Faecalibacterium prausnitzii]
MVSIPQTAPKINPNRRFFLRRAAAERARHKAADAAAAEILCAWRQKSIYNATSALCGSSTGFQQILTFVKMMLEEIAKADNFWFKKLS